MVKFAVCDDDPDAAKKVSDKLYEYYPNECEIWIYNDGRSLLEDIKRESFDAFFLDIVMPLIDGFEIAKQIRNNDSHVKIIFVTEKEEFAHLGYIYKAFRFVRKGKLDQELSETAKSLCKSLSSTGEYLHFKNLTGEIVVNIKTIKYFKAEGHYMMLYGPFEERIFDTMQELDGSLKKRGFIRIHKSYLVNYRYFYCIGSASVRLISGEELPMSRNRIQEVRKKVHEFCQLREE